MKNTLIKPLSKGQITIPAKFRKALKIKESTYFQAEIKDGGIFLRPVEVDWKDNYVRDLTLAEIKNFLSEDQLDKASLSKLRKYLG